MGENEEVYRMLAEINRNIGEIDANLENVSKRLQSLREDVDSLMSYKSHLLGIGSSVAFGIAAVGFLFGDIIRSFIRKSLGD